jgi:hypothetical protein
LLDPNGWYDQGQLALKPGVYTGSAEWYVSPYVTNLVLNYRHAKFAITPSLQVQAGAVYGSPYDVTGLDPRNCYANQSSVQVGTDPKTGAPILAGSGAVPVGSPTQQNCDFLNAGPGAAPGFTYLYIPNPQTGKFASYGQYRQPTIAMLNAQFSYDVSPKVTLQLTAADLWHSCFGGSSEPWTKASAPSKVNCGYYANGWYAGGNWYNGSSPQDAAANYGVSAYPWESQSYVPKVNNSIGGYIPFTLYLQAQIKL